MSATTTYEPTATTPRRRQPGGSGWALAGVGAGLSGLASIALSMSVSPPYDPDNPPTPESILAHLDDLVPNLLGFHLTTVLAAVLVLPFAAGLHRKLAGQAPSGSLHPSVAALGLTVLSAVLVLGSGLNTEFVFGLLEPELMVATDVSLYSHWVATISWLWVTAGVSGIAVGLAAVRHGALGKGVGIASLVLGALTLLLGISPLQYMAGFTGPVLLLVLATALLAGERRR